ncbi:MAG: rhodanese-like domain-containing protein [Erysipelotrichaceae bacterium]|jgi:phage shock protein E
MKKSLFFLVLLLILTGCNKNRSTYISITTSEAIEMMESEEDYIILDVRTLAEYEAGHIKGAVNFPNENIGNQMLDILPDKDQLIFVYCRSGNRSKSASLKLAEIGYTNIVEIGGINLWPFELEY